MKNPTTPEAKHTELTPEGEHMEQASAAMGERNDCAVIAVAIAFGLPYRTAHDVLSRHGRWQRQATSHFWDSLIDIAAELDAEISDVTEVMRDRGAKTALSAESKMPRQGTFIVGTYRHAFCFKDGQVHDWAKERRHRIQRIYRITEKDNNMPATYLNMKTAHGTETVDEITREDFPSFRAYRAEVKRLANEYRMAGMAVYTSTRPCKEWSDQK